MCCINRCNFIALLGFVFLACSWQHSQANLCNLFIAKQEQLHQLPKGLLGSIALVETGRAQAQGFLPWPWSSNQGGKGQVYSSKMQAIAQVEQMLQYNRSIDVGCMQINLLHHHSAFPSLETAFDPEKNVAYAAKFLKSLFIESKSWAKAVQFYHSRNPEYGVPYQKKVFAYWLNGDKKQEAEPISNESGKSYRLAKIEAWRKRVCR